MNGTKKAQTGAFQLVVYVGKVVVPAHAGTVPRSRARELQRLYKLHRPNVTTKVVKALS